MRAFGHAVLCAVLPAALAAQAGPAPEITIGGDTGRGAELGEVNQVLVLPSLLVVIEGNAPFVRVFDHQGRQRQAFGSAGAGPREFRRIDAVAYDSVNRVVWVADGPLSRMTRYAAAGDSLAFTAETRTELRPNNLCAMNGRLFALASRDGKLVHELSVSASSVSVARSFGEVRTALPLAANPGLLANVANGPMLCDASRDVVYTAATLYGEVHAVPLAGGTQTTTTIHDFVGMEIRPAGNAVSVGMPAGDGSTALSGCSPRQGVLPSCWRRRPRVPAVRTTPSFP